MDIAKYIGLFLLKNKYCCLQGLGNLEILKTASVHNGKELTGGVYYTKLNPVGSIDDAFPNFIANIEQVSIAKASNEISEFIKSAKAILAAGGTVVIPSVGQYVLKNHQLNFELDSAFSMPTNNIVFPIAEAPKPVVEEPKNGEGKPYESYTNYNNYNKQSAVNWNIVALWAVIIIIGGSILVWGIRYFMNQQPASSNEMVMQAEPQVEVIAPTVDTTGVDSVAAAPTNSTDTPTFKFIIKEYSTLAKAEKKEKQLLSYGYNVSISNKDSSTFYVISTFKIMPADTTKIKDSLTKLLNPAGVTLLK
ncbi:MAG: hypothetical protein V4561_09220 [Bacteroidota bacterium]